MENARSLASRFSGLLLFLLSLAVVGVLVYLTIRSADDNNGTDGQTADQTENQAEDNAVTTNSEEQTSSTATAGEDEDELANTGGGNVAGQTDGDDLPNTGPESTLAGAVALGALAWAGNAYIDSRRHLKQLQNR